MSNIKRPVAIVTGSTKGIGRGIAETLAHNGYSVVITSRDENQADNIAMSLRECGFDATGFGFNLENTGDTEKLISQTIEHYGSLHVLVNNALSATCVPDMHILEDESIRHAITSNLTNTLLLTKKSKPHLAATKGTVINIGSAVVNRHALGMALYSMIKGAIVQMTKSLAAEWASNLVRVNCINPGFVYSSALEEFNVPKEIIASTYAHCEQFHPLGNKIGSPEDIGNLVLYLSSENANMVTGSIFDIDAGYSVQGITMQPGV